MDISKTVVFPWVSPHSQANYKYLWSPGKHEIKANSASGQSEEKGTLLSWDGSGVALQSSMWVYCHSEAATAALSSSTHNLMWTRLLSHFLQAYCRSSQQTDYRPHRAHTRFVRPTVLRKK